ncbi:MAG: hypothetical protein IIA03_05730 [Proteobacteria bacterium]|nr:hypothetical protein [Pseudomonadota bacterium]
MFFATLRFAPIARKRFILLVGALAIAATALYTSSNRAPSEAVVSLQHLRTALMSRPHERGPLADELAFYESRLEARGGDDPLALRRLLSVHHTRYQAFGAKADLSRAEELLETLLARYPRDAGLRAVEAALSLTRHDFPGALRAARHAVRVAGADAGGVSLALFDAQLASGDYSGLLETMAPGDDARTFATIVRRARVRDRVGDLSGATADMERALALAYAQAQPDIIMAWCLVELAHLEHHGGEPGGAAVHYLEALSHVPGYPAALEGLGWIAWGIDRDPIVAESLFQRAVDHGGHADVLPTLAEIAEMRGADQAAALYRTRFLAAATGSEQRLQLYRRPLALMLAQDAETVAEALSLAEDDVAARPDQAGLAVLAWVLHRSGRGARALDAAKRAVAWGAPEPTTLHLAGRAALGSGDPALGRRLLKKALARRAELGPVVTEEIRELLRGA